MCIADIVAALNTSNITTVASCCGHEKLLGIVSLEDGRQLVIVPTLEEALHIVNKKMNSDG